MTSEADILSMEMLRQLLAIQNGMNEGLQGRLQRIKNRLVELIYQYAPQEADQQARTGTPPETLSEEVLACLNEETARGNHRQRLPCPSPVNLFRKG